MEKDNSTLIRLVELIDETIPSIEEMVSNPTKTYAASEFAYLRGYFDGFKKDLENK